MKIKPIPSWRGIRQHSRVRLATRVESRTTWVASVGRADNVSVGRLLVIAHDTFESGTEVVVRFGRCGSPKFHPPQFARCCRPGE